MSVKSADDRVRYVVNLIDQHQNAPLSVEELARAVNVSPSYLTRLFRRELGCGPAQFARDLRLDRAHALLQTTFMTVKEVMAAVGWNDPSHFSREFKRRFGVCPTDVRSARVETPQ